MTGDDEQPVGMVAALERQQRIFQGSPSFLAVVRGPEHVYEFANDAYQRLICGRPCLGLRFQDVLPEAVADGVLAILDNVYRTGIPFHASDFHSELDGPGGHPVNIIVNFQFLPIPGPGGHVTGVYIEGADVTERAQNEAALEFLRLETERRSNEIETLYQSTPIALALIGAQRFEYRRVNQVEADIFGVPASQIVGKTVRENAPNVAGEIEPLLRRVVAGETVRDVELKGDLPQRPGEHRSWLVSFAPTWLNGQVDAIIVAAIETTELRRAEQVALQNEKLAAVGRLAASIAHEINNPLEAVTNLLYLATHAETLAEVRELLELAETELRRVSAITTQTLSFHRRQAASGLVTCDSLLGGALAIYLGRLTSAKVQILKRKRAHHPILCFDGEIRQVLNNLVGNATDVLTTTGGRLFLRSREGPDRRTGRNGMWLTVADTGTGMTPETLRRAFDPFFSTKGIHGTGLGLWISRDIVARHKGRLLVRTSQNPAHHGTVMSLFLPGDTPAR